MNKITFLKYMRFTNLFALGLIAGELFTEWVALVPAIHSLPAPIFTQVKQGFLPPITPVMIFLMAFAVVSALAILIFSRNYLQNISLKKIFLINLIAFLLIVLFNASTLLINVPINQAELSWSVNAPPANWMEFRDRWELAHVFRTTLAIIAFILQLIAAFWLNEELFQGKK
jgi:hypothetical protein